MRRTREEVSSVPIGFPPGWVSVIFFFIFAVQSATPAFALRAVTPAESTVFLRNRLQEGSLILPLRFSGMEEDAVLRRQAAGQFAAYEKALEHVGFSQARIIPQVGRDDNQRVSTHFIRNGVYVTQRDLFQHDRDELALHHPAAVSFTDLGLSDPAELIILDEKEAVVIPQTGSGRTIATADHHFCLFVAMKGILANGQSQIVQWHLHAADGDLPSDLLGNLQSGLSNLLEHLNNDHRMTGITVVVSADPAVARFVTPDHLLESWRADGVERVAFFPREEGVNLSTVVNGAGIGAFLHNSREPISTEPRTRHSAEQLESDLNFHFISWNGLSTGVYQTLNHGIDPISNLFQQISIAPDQRKVWVVQASLLAQRHDLEVLVSRMPLEMADLILFGEGSVTAHELAARRQIPWINSNDPQALMPELNQHPNQTVVFLGDGSTSAEISQLISGDHTLIVLDPLVELSDLFRSLGTAPALLERIDWERLRSGLEEVIFT